MRNNSPQKIILKIISAISTIIAFFGVPLIGIPIIVLIIIICIYLVFILYNIVELCILGGWEKRIRNEINQLGKEIEELNDVMDSDETIESGAIIDLNDTDRKKEEKRYKEVRYEIRREEKKKIKEERRNNIGNLKIASCVAAILCILNCKSLYLFSQKMVLFAKEQIKTVEADKGAEMAETEEELETVEADKGAEMAETEEELETVEADKGAEMAETEEELETVEADKGAEMAETEEELETAQTDKGVEIAENKEKIEEPKVVIDEEKDAWVMFKLEHPEGYPGITDNEFDELCTLVLYFDEDDLEEKVISDITVWKNGCTDNSLLDNAVTPSGKSTTYYLNIENTFSNKDEKILSSNLLDEVIVGREELMELYPNGTLAWLLANHNQTYALNYLHQTKDGRSVLFLYMKSIFNTQKSLEFDMSIETKNERINYMKSRYKDISECTLLSDSIRLRALEIFVIMDENILNEVE